MTGLKQRILLFGLIACLASCLTPGAGSSDDIARISAEELRAMLGSPDIVVIDVRTEKDWKSSRLKIPGAVWEDFQEVEKWGPKYPKDKTIVLYCA